MKSNPAVPGGSLTSKAARFYSSHFAPRSCRFGLVIRSGSIVERSRLFQLGRLLPPMGQDDFQRLAADIASHGLLEEIVLYQGKILDGWSRYRACQARRIEPRFREFSGDDPVAYVLSKNVQRRHLSVMQILRVLEAARPALEAEAVARKRAALQRASATAD